MHKRKTIKIQEKPRKKPVFAVIICISIGKMCIFIRTKTTVNRINYTKHRECGRKASEAKRIRIENAFSLSAEDKIE